MQEFRFKLVKSWWLFVCLWMVNGEKRGLLEFYYKGGALGIKPAFKTFWRRPHTVKDRPRTTRHTAFYLQLQNAKGNVIFSVHDQLHVLIFSLGGHIWKCVFHCWLIDCINFRFFSPPLCIPISLVTTFTHLRFPQFHSWAVAGNEGCRADAFTSPVWTRQVAGWHEGQVVSKSGSTHCHIFGQSWGNSSIYDVCFKLFYKNQ